MENEDFERFWKVYPARKGDRAKQPAKVLFEKHIKAGINPEDIIHGAQKFAVLEADKIGTEFIMQAQRWLRNKRWMDFMYISEKPTADVTNHKGIPLVFVREDTPQWRAWQKIKRTPCVNFGWWFPSEWPPNIQEMK